MGTIVIGGMLLASSVDILIVPAIFYLVERISGAARPQGDAPEMLPSLSQGD
jgi:hypothetical protein